MVKVDTVTSSDVTRGDVTRGDVMSGQLSPSQVSVNGCDEALGAEPTDPIGSVAPSMGNVKRDVKSTSVVRRTETQTGGDFHPVFETPYPYIPVPSEARQLRHREML